MPSLSKSDIALAPGIATFLAVADAKSFVRAGKALGLTQSCVSRAIARRGRPTHPKQIEESWSSDPPQSRDCPVKFDAVTNEFTLVAETAEGHHHWIIQHWYIGPKTE